MLAPVALGASILLAYTLEAITGFGSIVIALSLGALVRPIDQVLPVLVPLNICMTGYLVRRHWQMVDRRLLLGTILPAMLCGTALGYLLLPYLDTQTLKAAFGALVLGFAARELWRMRHPAAPPQRPRWLTRLLTFGAGISHGLFASGGPLLVYGLAGTRLDKARLRATLMTVWLTLNGLLTLAFLADGRLKPALPQVAAYAPLLMVGVWLGERLHRRFDERHFRITIHAVLLITGLLLLAPWKLL
jgi:uncharacterized membrane protein YfcA